MLLVLSFSTGGAKRATKKPPLQEVGLPSYKPGTGQCFRAYPQPEELKVKASYN
jgi:hypothetical protein